jgi:hypothetical protein
VSVAERYPWNLTLAKCDGSTPRNIRVENVGDTASHSIFIELKEPRPTPARQDSLGPTTF